MKTAEDFKNQLLKISGMLGELYKIPVTIGTDKFYRSELNTIEAVGNKIDTVNSISRKFGITKGAVSQMVKKLEKRGFITKTRSRQNGKEIILTLTRSGEKAYHAHQEIHRETDRDILKLDDQFPEGMIENFYKILLRIETNIEKGLEKKG